MYNNAYNEFNVNKDKMNHQIETIDYKSANAKHKLVESLHNTGFAVLYNHPIDQKQITSVYAEWEKFFNDDEKYSYKFDPETQDGYFPYLSENAKGYSKKDLKEFFHYYEWGIYPNNMSNTTKLLYHDLLILGQKLLKWIDIHSPKNISSCFSMPLYQMSSGSKTNLLRILHYPPLNTNIEEGEIRAAEHEDINLITILVAGSQPGLQVKTNDDQWIEIECNAGWIVINSGDMLSECSTGYFPSTSHRVINPSGKASNFSRYTIPLFIHPRDEVVLSNNYTAKEFLHERLKEIGLKK